MSHQVGRDACRNPVRRTRHRRCVWPGAGTQFVGQVSWWCAEQGAEHVVRLPQHNLEGGNRRSRLFQHRARLLDVELGRRANAELFLGQRQHIFLNANIRSRDVDPLLGRAIAGVVRGQIGKQGDEHRVVILDRGVQVGVCRFDVPAKASPEIELPAQIESGLPIGIVIRENRGRSRREESGSGRRIVCLVLAEIVPAIFTQRLLRLRKQSTHRDRLLRPSLQHPCAGDTKREILPISRSDKFIELGIVEDRPPLDDMPILNLLVVAFDPVRSDRCRRLAVFRSDLESVPDPVAQSGRAAGLRQQQGEAQRERPSPREAIAAHFEKWRHVGR